MNTFYIITTSDYNKYENTVENPYYNTLKGKLDIYRTAKEIGKEYGIDFPTGITYNGKDLCQYEPSFLRKILRGWNQPKPKTKRYRLDEIIEIWG